jgi:hypothetical protein
MGAVPDSRMASSVAKGCNGLYILSHPSMQGSTRRREEVLSRRQLDLHGEVCRAIEAGDLNAVSFPHSAGTGTVSCGDVGLAP